MSTNDSSPEVLIVDDQPGDIGWLVDSLEARGYRTALATNEFAARRRFEAVKKGEASYAAAIIDVMVVIKEIEDLMELDEEFYRESRSTGIRLCRYAREELAITAQELPMASLSLRTDDEVKSVMDELGIPLYNRAADSDSEHIDTFIEQTLPRLPERTPAG